MTVNFSDSLKAKADAIERPPVIPTGIYVGRVTKHPELKVDAFKDKNDCMYDVVDFMIAPTAPHDVDEDELKAFGNITSAMPLRHRFMFNKDDEVRFDQTLFSLKQFLMKSLAVSFEGTLSQALNDAMNAQCLVFVKHRPDPNNEDVIYTEVAKTAPLE